MNVYVGLSISRKRMSSVSVQLSLQLDLEAKSEQVCAVLDKFVELNMLVKIKLCKSILEQLPVVPVFHVFELPRFCIHKLFCFVTSSKYAKYLTLPECFTDSMSCSPPPLQLI